MSDRTLVTLAAGNVLVPAHHLNMNRLLSPSTPSQFVSPSCGLALFLQSCAALSRGVALADADARLLSVYLWSPSAQPVASHCPNPVLPPGLANANLVHRAVQIFPKTTARETDTLNAADKGRNIMREQILHLRAL